MNKIILDKFTSAELEHIEPKSCQGNGKHKGSECC